MKNKKTECARCPNFSAKDRHLIDLLERLSETNNKEVCEMFDRVVGKKELKDEPTLQK